MLDLDNGRIQLLNEFASGAFGTRLFMGEVEEWGEVVVKVIPRPSVPSELKKRSGYFRDEVECGKVLHSPYVRAMYEAKEMAGHTLGYQHGVFYLVLEKLECTLSERLEEELPSLSEVRDLAWAVAHGLEAAHARPRPIVHRDLKPSNVLLGDRQYARAKVADFGIAREEGGTNLTTGLWTGTCRYMAPEQFQKGAAITPKADIYAYGLLLWECLTGQVPGDGSDPMLIKQQRTAANLTGSISLESGSRRHLESVLNRCLMLDPAKRPSSILEALREILNAGVADRMWKLLPDQATWALGGTVAADELQLDIDDHRENGGAFWVYAPQTLGPELKEKFPQAVWSYSEKRSGWWTRDAGPNREGIKRIDLAHQGKPSRDVQSTGPRKPSAQFMRPMQPDRFLAAIVGSKPLPRTEVTKKLWEYIKTNRLQDPKNRRTINADMKLAGVLGGKRHISMFEMTKYVNDHLLPIE